MPDLDPRRRTPLQCVRRAPAGLGSIEACGTLGRLTQASHHAHQGPERPTGGQLRARWGPRVLALEPPPGVEDEMCAEHDRRNEEDDVEGETHQ